MKLKTRKSMMKRVKITGSGKILIRTGGQNHFNARERGKTAINKRRDKELSNTNRLHIKTALPYR